VINITLKKKESMPHREFSNLYFGYCEGEPVVAAFPITEDDQEIARKALAAVNVLDDIVEAPHTAWMAVKADVDLTPQETMDKLSKFGEAAYVDGVRRDDLARYIGRPATSQLLGRRPGVL
jgi:hypothetical protein